MFSWRNKKNINTLLLKKAPYQELSWVCTVCSDILFKYSRYIQVYVIVFSAIAAGIRGGCFSIAIIRLNIRIRNLLFSSMMSQEIGFFDKTTTGE